MTASLVVDGSQTRLLFTADDSGAAAISISADDDDSNDSVFWAISIANIDSGSLWERSEARSSRREFHA